MKIHWGEAGWHCIIWWCSYKVDCFVATMSFVLWRVGAGGTSELDPFGPGTLRLQMA